MNAEFNSEILKKAKDKIDKENYCEICFQAEICPVCGETILWRQGHGYMVPPSLVESMWKCSKCEFEYVVY